ncbi:MAG: permease prefix domain 1-containing protein [Pseudomonadota bacterium]
MRESIPNDSYAALGDRLRVAGVDERWVRRLEDELTDHYCTLYDEAIGRGHSPQAAREHAVALMGNADSVLAASWSTHLDAPRLVATPNGLAIAVDEVTPFSRWAMAGFLGSAITAATLFFMQLAIFSGL